MMILRDNRSYKATPQEIDAYLSLQSVANRNISELLNENGDNLLIYPHSFSQCEDKIDDQELFSLQTSWKEKQCTKAVLTTGNIAGFIGVNGQSVSIQSRFAEHTDKDFFLQYMLDKVLGINIVNLPHGTAADQIFNFLLFLFPKFLNDALSQGIYKEYQRNEYNDSNVRGTIDINRHLKTNTPFNGRIAYRTREFSHDNNVTELIRHAIDYISKTRFGKALLENDSEIHANVSRIIAATPRYNRQERDRIIRNNLKIVSHPYYSRYTPLRKLCLRILRHEKIKYGSNDNEIFGILFDVSWLWEEYLATIFIPQGFSHPDNRKKIGRIYLAKANKLDRYPDFYREQDSIIIDAKYKRSVNRDDIHQIISYMYRLKGHVGVFIKPSDEADAHRNGYELLGYGEDYGAHLRIESFPISTESRSYDNFKAEMMTQESIFASKYMLK